MEWGHQQEGETVEIASTVGEFRFKMEFSTCIAKAGSSAARGTAEEMLVASFTIRLETIDMGRQTPVRILSGLNREG